MKESSLPADELNRTVDLAEARSRHQVGARRFAVGLSILSLALVASVVLATGIGRMDVGWGAIAAVVLGKLGFHTGAVDRTTEVVVWGIRLSRVVLSGLVGAALATAGVIFQGLLLNPLADPFTLGVSTGAAFGVALLVMLGVGGSFLGLSPLPLGALAGAMGAMAAVMVLSRESGRIRKETLILAGIVVSTFLAALISLIKSLDEESLSAIVFWIMGSFSGRGWIHVGFLLPYLAAGLALGAVYHRELDIMALGEEQSHHLGVAGFRGQAEAAAGGVAAHRRGGVGLRGHRLCGPGGTPPGAGAGRPLPRPPLGVVRRHRRPDPDLGRRPGPHPVVQRPGAAGGRGQRPAGRAVFLLSVEIPPFPGDVVIRVEALDLGYEDRPVLAGLNFQVDRGEFLGILGPNGSGKSTLLHALSGLLPPQKGRIVVKSEPLEGLPSRLRAQILAVVPQSTDVRFPFSCLEIVLMGRYPHRRRLGTLTDADLVWALKSMRRTTTAHLKERPIIEVSGGECQRVVIARALAQDPEILLLDEATSSLDVRKKLEIFELLKYLSETRGLTVLCAMHDLNLAALYCRRLMFIKEGGSWWTAPRTRCSPRRSSRRFTKRPWRSSGTRSISGLTR